jgi:hypothetical protein
MYGDACPVILIAWDHLAYAVLRRSARHCSTSPPRSRRRPSLADLGLEAGAIEAVGEAVSAAPISAADLYPARSRYLLRQVYVGNRPEERSS